MHRLLLEHRVQLRFTGRVTALDPGLASYLTTNRDFRAPVIGAAVGALGIEPGTRVLDAGIGAGGALAPLAAAVGPTGSVLAVDLDPAVVALAAEQAGSDDSPWV